MSVADRIADAVVALIEGLALEPTPMVKKRKKPAVTKRDTLPLVLVVGGNESDPEALWAGSVGVKYTVTVLIAAAAENTLWGSGAVRDWREEIRKALCVNELSGVSEMSDHFPLGRPPFDPAGLDANYDWSVQAFEYETIENRN